MRHQHVPLQHHVAARHVVIGLLRLGGVGPAHQRHVAGGDHLGDLALGIVHLHPVRGEAQVALRDHHRAGHHRVGAVALDRKVVGGDLHRLGRVLPAAPERERGLRGGGQGQGGGRGGQRGADQKGPDGGGVAHGSGLLRLWRPV